MPDSPSILTASKLCAINSEVTKIKTDIQKHFKNISNFSKIKAQAIADCGPLKKLPLAEHLLKIISIVEPLSEYNIQLEHPENVDINQIQQVVTKCISKECNDLNASNEFSINSVKDDVKKLDALVNEIKNTLSNTTYDTKNLDFPSTENRPPAPVPVSVMNPTKHINK